MIFIEAQEKALSFKGDSQTALTLVNSLREADYEMPKMLSDFCFNIEAALQDAGVLDEWFNEVTA
jgi:predicted lipid carrier protein YhbT